MLLAALKILRLLLTAYGISAYFERLQLPEERYQYKVSAKPRQDPPPSTVDPSSHIFYPRIWRILSII